MTHHEPLPALSPLLSELVDGVLGWIINRIERREGFSAVMVSRRGGENRATHFHAPTVEEALESAELREALAGATAYALSYDGRARSAEGERRVLLCRVEEAGMARAHELALFYELREGEDRVSIEPERHLQPTGRTFPPLLQPEGPGRQPV